MSKLYLILSILLLGASRAAQAVVVTNHISGEEVEIAGVINLAGVKRSLENTYGDLYVSDY